MRTLPFSNSGQGTHDRFRGFFRDCRAIYPDIQRAWHIHCEAYGKDTSIPAASKLTRYEAERHMERLLQLYPTLKQELPGQQIRKRHRSASSTRSTRSVTSREISPREDTHSSVSTNYKGKHPWTESEKKAKYAKTSPGTHTLTPLMMAEALRKQSAGPQKKVYAEKEHYTPTKETFKKPDWIDTFKPILSEELKRDHIKLILINNEQYLLSGTENQYVMDKFVITGTTITEPVVTVPWSSLYELIKQANTNPQNHEEDANMEWTYGLTIWDGYPSWEKNKSQTNGVWNMEKLMTKINANLPKSEPRYTIATVNETVTHNTPKHESVVQPTNKVAQQTFTPEVTAKEISPETYKAKGRGTRPNMFKMTDEELKKCAGGNTGEMPLLRNQQASTSQHASNYYSNELEIIHTSLIEQHKTQNEKIARNASNKIREILTKEGPVSTLPTIPGNIQTSQIQMESIRVENIQLPENEQEQEDIEMLESEPTNVQETLKGDETFMVDNTVQRAPHSGKHRVESHTSIGDTTFGPTTSNWAETAEEKISSMAAQAESYDNWVDRNPLPESVKIMRQRNIDKLAQQLADTNVKAKAQEQAGGELILNRGFISNKGQSGKDIKTETQLEQDEFQNSLTEEEKLLLTTTKLVEAEAVAKAHTDKIARLQAEQKGM
jgi:hypothetical protein